MPADDKENDTVTGSRFRKKIAQPSEISGYVLLGFDFGCIVVHCLVRDVYAVRQNILEKEYCNIGTGSLDRPVSSRVIQHERTHCTERQRVPPFQFLPVCPEPSEKKECLRRQSWHAMAAGYCRPVSAASKKSGGGTCRWHVLPGWRIFRRIPDPGNVEKHKPDPGRTGLLSLRKSAPSVYPVLHQQVLCFHSEADGMIAFLFQSPASKSFSQYIKYRQQNYLFP